MRLGRFKRFLKIAFGIRVKPKNMTLSLDWREQCKNCGHVAHWHSIEEYNSNIKTFKDIQDSCRYFNDEERDYCNCKEFVPENNLKYLEYKYEQSQLASR